MKEQRDRWLEQFVRVKLDQFVFIDEFGAATNMTRTRARAPRGERAVCKTPHGHWKVISTIAAMSVRGGIACSASFDGATARPTPSCLSRSCAKRWFRRWCLGRSWVLDNLPAHRSPLVEQLIESAGCRLLRLPPYSPDLNPIEMAISKVKALLRSLARRTVGGLFDGIAQALASVTVTDARHYIEHCGYAAT